MRQPTRFPMPEEIWVNLALAVIPTLLVLITLGLMIVLRDEDTRLRTALCQQRLETEVVDLTSALEEPLATEISRSHNHTTHQVNDRVEVNGRRHVLRYSPRINNLRERFSMGTPHLHRDSASASTVRNVENINGMPLVPERTSSTIETALHGSESHNPFHSQGTITHDDANASTVASAAGDNILAQFASMARTSVDHSTEAGLPVYHERTPSNTNAAPTANANDHSTVSTATYQQLSNTAMRSPNSAINGQHSVAANSVNNTDGSCVNGHQAIITPGVNIHPSSQAFLIVLSNIASENNTPQSNVSRSSSNVSGDTLVESSSGDEPLLGHSLSGDTLVERLIEVTSGPQFRVGLLRDSMAEGEDWETMDEEVER